LTNPQLQQKRFFCVTVNPGHLNSEWKPVEKGGQGPPDVEELKAAYRQWWVALGEYPALQWRKGQIEVSDAGLVHIQAAIKLNASQRAHTLRERLMGHFEPARNWVALKNYVQKTSDRMEFLGEDGEDNSGNRTEGFGSAKQRAIEALRDGMTPLEIARTDPDAYFTHWRAIEALWEKLNTGG
jgi:hypothetical protein